MRHTADRVVEDLLRERHAGALRIAESAAAHFRAVVHRGEPASPEAFRRECLRLGVALIAACPTCGPLINLVNAILWSAEADDSPRALRQAVADTSEMFERQIHQHALIAAERALSLISDDVTIVTVAASSTVRNALRLAQRAGRRFRVLAADTAGGDMLGALRADGIITAHFDCSADEPPPGAVSILIGADLISADGLVNIAGTARVVEWAQQHMHPAYAVSASEKFTPMRPAPGPSQQMPVASAADIPCDLIPLTALGGVVTERGTLTTVAIEAWLATVGVHPMLSEWFGSRGTAVAHGI
jgi:translation initiation factor 2B subunit (eIF-2B alpha/beta/delta family)